MAKLQSVNSVAGKETIYVDVDDEITTIIDKVGAAKSKVVALVLPKRAPVLQSVVNMKLLKRTADNAGKNLVLITSEAGLMPLAGVVGLHVASTPTSRPSIPDTLGSIAADDDEATEELEEPIKVVDGNRPDSDNEEDFDPKAAGATAIGTLAAADLADDDDTIDMNNEPDETPLAAVAAKLPKPKKDKKAKKDKDLKVPNFDRFRKLIVLGIVLIIILVVAWIFAFTVLPKADITIGTDSSTIPSNLTLSLDTTATSLDQTDDTVPAVAQTQQKTNTATVQATGQQNNGAKATGTVTMSAGSCGPTFPSDIPAGTTLSTNNITYVLDDAVTFNSSHNGVHCTFTGEGSQGESDIPITALSSGSNGNVSSASFTVTGNSGVTASGSTSGGTDNITTIVQQSDISNATGKVSSPDTSSIKQALESSLEADGLQPVPATFLAGTPVVTTNQQAGAAASSVTATAATTYTMLGVKKSDLQTLIDSNVEGQLDKGKQVILDDGVANAQFAEANPGTSTTATVAMTTSSLAGPQLNANALKSQLAGMKSQDVQSYVKQTPGVTSVSVKYSPFWVDSVPKNSKKVTVMIEKAAS